MEINLNKGVSPNIFLFKIVGQWPFCNKNAHKIYRRFVMASLYLYNLTGLMYLFKNLDNAEEVSATIYNLLSTIAVVLKVTIFQKNLDKIKNIVKFFQLREFQPENEKQKELLKSGIFLANFIFYYFFTTAALTLVMWIIFPILDNERRLPSNAWFPYDYLSAEFYSITYVWQSILICYHAFTNVGLDTLFAMLMIQTGAQCDVLNERVANLGKFENIEFLHEDLLKCIDHHKAILQLSHEIGCAFGNIILVQFATSVLVLCETMFLLSLMTIFNATYIMLLFYQLAIFTQIFLYCWFGNEVVLKSGKFYYSAYASNWIECPQNFKKDLLFFMHRTQKPIILLVGDMFPVSLITFMNILQSSWAYFMALRKIHNK